MLFAVDTNPLIDWAQGYEDIPDCFELIKKRIPGVAIIVPPTVLHEIGHFAQTNAKNLGADALRALELMRDETVLKPLNLAPAASEEIRRLIHQSISHPPQFP